jgi:Golgi apparatus protein 1
VVLQGDARVIRCLQTQREKLSSHCRAEMFNEEVRFSENIDFQYPMKQACLREIDRYCKDVPHGQARVIRWAAYSLLLAGAAAAGLRCL